MANIEVYRYFDISDRVGKYIFRSNRKLTLKEKRYFKKYSDVSLFDKAGNRKRNLYYFVYVDKKYAGYLSLEIHRYFKQLYIEFIYVDDEFRQMGLAKLMFKHAVEDAKKYFKKIRTIQAFPTSLEGKWFMESAGFLPDVYYCSRQLRGTYSVYYLYEEDTFILDQKEFELVCGTDYKFTLVGVKRYLKLIEELKVKDPSFSEKNYCFFLKHLKKDRKYVPKPRKQTEYDSIFTSGNFSMDFSMQQAPDLGIELKEVPCMFSQEYVDRYLHEMP